MVIQVLVPSPGESISQVQVAGWLVADGDYVEKDAEIAEIDSDKATLSITAEASGKITFIASEGDTLDVGSVIAEIDTDAEAPAQKPKKTAAKPEKSGPRESPVASGPSQGDMHVGKVSFTPLAREILRNKNIPEDQLAEALRNLKVTKSDVEKLGSVESLPASVTAVPREATRDEVREKMSTLRLKLAQRLVGVKNETAMLTTFNEVNMTPVKEIRAKFGNAFAEKYGLKLGYMAFFTRAVTLALEEFPKLNSRIEGDEIVTPSYVDVGIAVSAPKGLVVPVIRNAGILSIAEIEQKIKDLGDRARENRITLEEMSGGTFTISNGGVFGSMLSTPILNPPQSAILGMHNIIDRPIAVDGKVEIHPVMYVALSYDHRVIDGRESVGFLLRVKEILEDPSRMLSSGKDPHQALLGL